jgi:signal transduction histidine kinase
MVEGAAVTLGDDQAPAVRIDALEMFVNLLARVEEDGSSEEFYGRLCEAACALTSMDRAILFRYDETQRRVRAAGSHNVPLDVFAGTHLTVETAPIARQALAEDRVLDVRESAETELELPDRYRSLLRDGLLVCTPIAASGRWTGVILSDRPGNEPLTDNERYLLWTIGKVAALATHARIATRNQELAKQLQERIDLAREIHEGVIQRLFGISMAFSADQELSAEARGRIGEELNGALRDLRTALGRPLGRMARPTQMTFAEEFGRLADVHPELGLSLNANLRVPEEVEPLAQSVLIEAVRNASKHADPTQVDVSVERIDDTFVMEVCNDGVHGRPRPQSGMGLRLAALEAIQAGGIIEFGEREPGIWRVRLAVPLERA